MALFELFKFNVHVLPQWQDIDTYEDLECFLKTYSHKGTTAFNTAAYLSSIGVPLKKD